MKKIREIAKWALEKADGQWEEAIRLFHKRLDDDPALRTEIVGGLLAWAIKDAIEETARQDREPYWGAQRTAPEDHEGHLAALKATARMRLMDYRLRGGKRLGEATKADVLIEVKWFRKYGEGCLVRARWFSAIARQLKKETDTVGKVLSEQRLRSLQKAAERHDN